MEDLTRTNTSVTIPGYDSVTQMFHHTWASPKTLLIHYIFECALEVETLLHVLKSMFRVFCLMHVFSKSGVELCDKYFLKFKW